MKLYHCSYITLSKLHHIFLIFLCTCTFVHFPQNADLLKEVSRLKDLNTAQANALRQKDRKIAELEQQLLGRKKPSTNIDCQRQVRHVTHLLSKDGHEFDTQSNIHTPHNQQLLQRVIRGVMASKEAVNFTTVQVIETAKIHFNSLRGEVVRQQNGGKAKHRKGSRSGARKFKKVKHRLSGLNHAKCPLSADDKQKARLIIKREYMSSDEDELETNEEGKQYRRVRHLPWMSDLAIHYKTVCHDVYVNHVLTKRDAKKYQHLIRDENCPISERAVPKEIPTWAVKV